MLHVDPLAIAAEKLEREVAAQRSLTDPAGWISAALGEFAWSKQREIAASVAANRRTVVESCHGVGKSWLAARIGSWWICSHPPGEAMLVTTAPTFPQVRAILWKEIGRAHRKGGLIGRVNQTEWLIGSELVGLGRKPSDYDQAAFQGIHARYVLVIIDEGDGVPQQLYTDAGALLTNDDCRMLVIGNPDQANSHMARIAMPGSGWTRITISAFESPNFTDEPVPDELRPYLVNRTYVDEVIADYGEDSPIYSAKVLGKRPKDDDNGVVPWSGIQACRVMPLTFDTAEPVELGVDVGAGGDMTVVWERRGPKAGRVWRKRTPHPSEVTALALEAIDACEPKRVKIDSIGVGWGPAGDLERLRHEGRHKAEIVKVNVGAAASQPHRFAKLRDEVWWMARQLTQSKGWDLSAIDDQTAAQLAAPRWATDTAGRVKVESKDDLRGRIGRSPDDADALLLAYYTGSGQGAAFLEAWEAMADEAKGA